MALFVLNPTTVEPNNDLRVHSGTLELIAKAAAGLPSVIRLVGHKARQPSLEIELHSMIDQAEPQDQQLLQGTKQRFAMQAVESLRLRAPTVIAQRSALRAAETWVRQLGLAIRRPSETLVVVRLDLQVTTQVEPLFEIARDG